MADTVVQYVLRVDSKGAQKALDSTAKEADDLTKSLDKLGNESKDASKDLGETEKSSKKTSKGLQGLRRLAHWLELQPLQLAQSPPLAHLDRRTSTHKKPPLLLRVKLSTM